MRSNFIFLPDFIENNAIVSVFRVISNIEWWHVGRVALPPCPAIKFSNKWNESKQYGWLSPLIQLLNAPFALIISNDKLIVRAIFIQHTPHAFVCVCARVHVSIQWHIIPVATIDLGFVYGSAPCYKPNIQTQKKRAPRNNEYITFKTLGSTRITHFRCKMAKELLARKSAERTPARKKNPKTWQCEKCMNNYRGINWRQSALWIKMKFVKNGVRRKFMVAHWAHVHRTQKHIGENVFCSFFCGSRSFYFTFGEAFHVGVFFTSLHYARCIHRFGRRSDYGIMCGYYWAAIIPELIEKSSAATPFDLIYECWNWCASVAWVESGTHP